MHEGNEGSVEIHFRFDGAGARLIAQCWISSKQRFSIRPTLSSAMAKAMIHRGAQLRGIAFHTNRKIYQDYERMPLLTEEAVSEISACPKYNADYYLSQYVWANFECSYPYGGIITFYDSNLQPLSFNVFTRPSERFFAQCANGYYYSSGASFFTVNGIKVQIGSEVDCKFARVN